MNKLIKKLSRAIVTAIGSKITSPVIKFFFSDVHIPSTIAELDLYHESIGEKSVCAGVVHTDARSGRDVFESDAMILNPDLIAKK